MEHREMILDNETFRFGIRQASRLFDLYLEEGEYSKREASERVLENLRRMFEKNPVLELVVMLYLIRENATWTTVELRKRCQKLYREWNVQIGALDQEYIMLLHPVWDPPNNQGVLAI